MYHRHTEFWDKLYWEPAARSILRPSCLPRTSKCDRIRPFLLEPGPRFHYWVLGGQNCGPISASACCLGNNSCVTCKHCFLFGHSSLPRSSTLCKWGSVLWDREHGCFVAGSSQYPDPVNDRNWSNFLQGTWFFPLSYSKHGVCRLEHSCEVGNMVLNKDTDCENNYLEPGTRIFLDRICLLGTR